LELPQTTEFDANGELAALVRDETDNGLLKLMAGRSKDETWADAAFCEFYARHKAYMWTVCKNVVEDLNGDAWVEDIFVQTFERAYEKAKTFKLPSGVSPASATRLVRGWLGTIAANLLRCLLRNHECEYAQDQDGWEKIRNSIGGPEADGEQEETNFCAERKLIGEALEALSEREQLVLRITFQYHRVGERFQRLPNKVSQELAQQLATTPENLRKIRERALTKVSDYVNQHRSDARPGAPNQ